MIFTRSLVIIGQRHYLFSIPSRDAIPLLHLMALVKELPGTRGMHFDDVTPAFEELSNLPHEISSTVLSIIERFVVMMYQRTSCISDVNTARIHLFSSDNRQIETIPPTQACLIQHIKRAAYQAGYVWRQSLEALQSFPSPGE